MKTCTFLGLLILCFLLTSCGRIWGGITFVGGGISAVYNPFYNGVMNVQAYGDAPGAPPGTPSAREVSITWPAFTNATVASQFVLVRTAIGQALSFSTSTTCTAGTLTSCLVCTVTGAGTQTCVDTNIATSPQQYDYAIADKTNLTANPARITVAIPPSDMVLVQRDAANYEMCALLGQSTDPVNYQRCHYTGLGAAPYNTNPGNAPLNLPPGYYDFGYNLFVDRWEAACNWTNAANGGACNGVPNHTTPGNCYGSGAPNIGTGAVGNVYYDTTGEWCYYFDGANWQNGAGLTLAEKTAIYTIDPTSNGGFKPPITNTTAQVFNSVCSQIVDPNYGAKRLLRHREFVVGAAIPWLAGEPGALTDAQVDTLEGGNGHGAGTYSCNSDAGAGICPAAFATGDCAGDGGGGVLLFVIGSTASSQCISRFGAQDMAGNVAEWESDALSPCNAGGHTCTGTTSSFDSGNTDMNGFLFNGAEGPGAANTTNWVIQAASFGTVNFSPPLGIPLVGNDGGNAVSLASFTAKLHNDYYDLRTDDGNITRALYVGGMDFDGNHAGRWNTAFWDTNSDNGAVYGFRCAVPAQ